MTDIKAEAREDMGKFGWEGQFNKNSEAEKAVMEVLDKWIDKATQAQKEKDAEIAREYQGLSDAGEATSTAILNQDDE